LTDLLIGTIAQVMFSTFSRLQSESERFRRTYYTGVRLTAAVALPVFVGLAVLSADIVDAVLGDKWAEAAPVIAVLSLLGIVHAVGSFNVTALTSLGYPHYNFRFDAINAVVTLCAIVVAAPWGLKAVAIAYVGRAYVLWPLRFLVLRRICGFSFRELGLVTWGTLAASLIMGGVLLWLRTVDFGVGPVPRLAILVSAGALVYAAAGGFLARETLR
jgi:PST family polysaccharide transporter